MKKTIVFIFLVVLILLNTKIVSAQAKILINEFLVEPQPQQVEIINIGSESANLKNWIIDDDGGSSSFYKIEEDLIIYPQSCLVFSSNFYLNVKSQDTIRLFDEKNNIIDSFLYKSSPGENISFQRLPDGESNWSTQSANIGLFNNSKIPCLLTPTPTLTPTLTSTPTLSPSITQTPTTITPIFSITPTPTIFFISYDNIFISEAMVNPKTNEKEWVELFNNNDFTVFLTNWYLDDIEKAGSAPKSFSIEIPAKSYKAIILSSSIFNNSGDSIRLLDFNNNLKDSFEYQSSTQNKTWGRIDFKSDNFCLQEPSFEKENNPCINNNSNDINYEPTTVNLSTISDKNIIQPKTNKILKKFNNSNLFIEKNNYYKNHSSPEVLGTTTFNKKNNQFLDKKNTVDFFSFNSIFYSFLTEIMILIKMRLKYGKIKKLLLSLIYSK